VKIGLLRPAGRRKTDRKSNFYYGVDTLKPLDILSCDNKAGVAKGRCFYLKFMAIFDSELLKVRAQDDEEEVDEEVSEDDDSDADDDGDDDDLEY
jgi:hypothetical protein